MNQSGFVVFATLIAFLWIDGGNCCDTEVTPPDICRIEKDIIYFGHDVQHWVSKGEEGLEECQQKCVDLYPNCKGFFFDKKLGQCHTKTKLADRTQYSGVTSGICIAVTDYCRIDWGVRYFGHDKTHMVSKGEAGVEECQQKCFDLYPNCKGFTLDKKRGKCFTKTKLAGRKKESGYTSGICMADEEFCSTTFQKPPMWKICQRPDAKERPCCKEAMELYNQCREIDPKEYPQCNFDKPNDGYFKERQCSPSGHCVCVCKNGVSNGFTNCTESESEYERLSTELASLEFADEEYAALNLYKKN